MKILKRPNPRIVVADGIPEAIALRQEEERIFISDPATLVFDFVAKKAINDLKIIDVFDYDQTKRSMRDITAAEAIKKIISKPRFGNVELMLKENYSKDSKIVTSPEGGVLLIDYLYSKGEKLDNEILLNASLNEMCIFYEELKNPTFYPFALERLLKLFSAMMKKNISKESNGTISLLQQVLLLIDNKFDGEKIKEEIISQKETLADLIVKVVESVRIAEVASGVTTANSLYNKLYEELSSFQNKLTKINLLKIEKVGDHIKMVIEEDLSEEFVLKYTEIL